jgi:hypothetical protein
MIREGLTWLDWWSVRKVCSLSRNLANHVVPSSDFYQRRQTPSKPGILHFGDFNPPDGPCKTLAMLDMRRKVAAVGKRGQKPPSWPLTVPSDDTANSAPRSVLLDSTSLISLTSSVIPVAETQSRCWFTTLGPQYDPISLFVQVRCMRQRERCFPLRCGDDRTCG